jgi:LmbE family N-acetylglucosaminyl deacetylase
VAAYGYWKKLSGPTMESLHRRTKHIFLSPHLDDAVFSCGGLIARASSLGCPVEVHTFYTKQVNANALPPEQQKIAAKYAMYEKRKKEDSAALFSLGAKPIWTNYTERFFSPPWLDKILHIFKTPMDASLDKFANVPSIKQYLIELCDTCSEAYLFAPLGIGNHYDHVELFLASLITAQEKKAWDRFFFYEDAYSLGTRMRMRHFVSGSVCWRWWQAPAVRSIKWFLKSNLMALQASGRTAVEYLPEHFPRMRWSVRTEPLQGFEEKKLKAVSMYKTQAKALGGMPMLARIYRCYHRFWVDAEPYWAAIIEEPET